MLIAYNGILPQVAPDAYVQESARVIGDVVLGAASSVWFNVVLRGDVHYIRIGARSNIQDNSTVHVTTGTWPTLVGDDVTVGHGVILHGCEVGDRCLVGMGAIVMDEVRLEEECLVAAGALLTPRTRVPARHLVAGSPAKIVRELRPQEIETLHRSARNYVAHAKSYRDQGIL